MITSISIENFKGIAARVTIPLKPITLPGNPGPVVFSPDGKTAYVAVTLPPSENLAGAVVPIRTATGTVLTPVKAGEQISGLAITPDGRFDGPPPAWKYLSYRQAGTDKLLQDYATRRRFHDPGLLAKIWGNSP